MIKVVWNCVECFFLLNIMVNLCNNLVLLWVFVVLGFEKWVDYIFGKLFKVFIFNLELFEIIIFLVNFEIVFVLSWVFFLKVILVFLIFGKFG